MTIRILFLALALAAALPPTALSEPIRSQVTLRDLGIVRPERLFGLEIKKEYFVPLPVRTITPGASEVRFVLAYSPFLSGNSSVTVLVNGIATATVRLPKNQTAIVVSAPVPAEYLDAESSGQHLSIALQALLDGETSHDRCHVIALGTLWLEVQPSSGLFCEFDNQDPDWLSIARLPFTLRPRVILDVPRRVDPGQLDLALKLASWIAYLSPSSQVEFGADDVAPGEPVDIVRIDNVGPDGAQIRVEAEGDARTVTFHARTAKECATVWNALRVIDLHRLPGSNWKGLEEEGLSFQPKRRKSIYVESISPDFVANNVGIGGISRTFRFDLALFGSRPAEVTMRLKGLHKRIYRVGSATVIVRLNGRVVFTEDLDPDSTTFDFVVPFDQGAIVGDNEVAVTIDYIPTSEECTMPLFNFFWQLDPACALIYSGESSMPDPRELLEAAQQFYARNAYEVLLGSHADWKSAAYAIMWLQKVNKLSLLEPRVVNALSAGAPALCVGASAPMLANWTGTEAPPVIVGSNALEFKSGSGGDFFKVASSASVGIWQLAYRAAHSPVIFADPWGEGGLPALEAMSRQIASAPWYGSGDVLLGDGVAPALAMSSRETVHREVDKRDIQLAKLDWRRWRWWIVGAIWLLLSAVILWIFNKSRRNAGL